MTESIFFLRSKVFRVYGAMKSCYCARSHVVFRRWFMGSFFLLNADRCKAWCILLGGFVSIFCSYCANVLSNSCVDLGLVNISKSGLMSASTGCSRNRSA